MKQQRYIMCALTVIPVRATSSDASEIVTQLLFGETAGIIEQKGNWLKIEIHHDNYVGWIDEKQIVFIDNQITSNQAPVIYQQETELLLKTPWGVQRILKGSPIISKNQTFKIASHSFEWLKTVPKIRSHNLLEIAKAYINTPYLWGGRTWYGIDCSGLMQTLFHQVGKLISRDASQQIKEGDIVSFEAQKPGDLAFFHSATTGNITHVGMVLPNHEIIHAHGHVRIDSLDREGIYNTEKNYYSHPLTKIIRIHF